MTPALTWQLPLWKPVCLAPPNCSAERDPRVSGAGLILWPALPPPATRIVFVTTVSCISILLLFLSVFFIYRRSQHGPSHEENQPFQISQEGYGLKDSQEVTHAELNAMAPSEAAPVPAEEAPDFGDMQS